LFDDQIIPRQQLDTQSALVDEQRAVIATDQAQVDRANLQLSYTRITSPIDGRVGLRQVDVGNIVHPSDATALTVITQIHPAAVVFYLPANRILAVAQALRRRRVLVEAYSDDDRIKLGVGYLLTMDTALDATSGELKLKAEFDNSKDLLWPGEFVHVRVWAAAHGQP
jgi:multidrug efflux system membrane fusion protein